MTVPAGTFVPAMEAVWTDQFGNSSSPRFRALWAQMAETYLQAIRTSMAFNPLQIGRPSWLVLAPEMGAGKTVGACVYLALMAREWRSLPVKIGGLLVCRTIKQCDDCADMINRFAGFPDAAIARHSETQVTLERASKHPILVITHAALIAAGRDGSDRLEGLLDLHPQGKRCLTIIDEALADVVSLKQLTTQDLHMFLGFIPPAIAQKHVEVLSAVRILLTILERPADSPKEVQVLWDRGGLTVPFLSELPDRFADLFKELKGDVRMNPRWNDSDQRRADWELLADISDSVSIIHQRWAMLVASGEQAQLRGGLVYIPGLVCPVILNATALQDVFLDSIDAEFIPTQKVRTYRNLCVRVAWRKGLGKSKMVLHGETRLQALSGFISTNSTEGDQWLIVLHKKLEARAARVLPPNCKTAHWGALDGLNDFKECNKAVLFGLSYRDPHWSSQMYFALRGVQSEDWLTGEAGRKTKHDIESKLIASHVIQAIGRTRCRKVCDAEGNCLPTELYVMLPPNWLGYAVEKTIRETLSDVRVENWAFNMDRFDGVESPSEETDFYTAVVIHMQNSPPGRYLISEVAAALNLTKRQIAALKDSLSKGRPVTDRLQFVGVHYYAEGRGRAAKSYLTKDPR